MARVACRGAVPRGALSAPFALADLELALRAARAQCVYAHVDAAGRLRAAEGGGAARLVAHARLAPHVAARSAELCAHGEQLRLRALAPLSAGAELLLWFDEPTLARLRMPFLTLRNIAGRREYSCHECGTSFEEPNPLKLHLFLHCARFEPVLFWRRAAERLRVASPPPAPSPEPPPLPAAAQLEALATEWGRLRGGHVCVYCGKLYSRRYGLKIHIRTHTGYRPLRCRYCARAFGDPSNLNKHVRLHAAPRRAAPHACAQCGRALPRRRDLERHARTHHAPAARQ